MIYDGDDEILRSICEKLEDNIDILKKFEHLKISCLWSFSSINCLITLSIEDLYSIGFPFTEEERAYGTVMFRTNRFVFKDELGWGYLDIDMHDDVHRRFSTKGQANREYYEHFKEIDRKYHRGYSKGIYRGGGNKE